jgi:excisionase family DNA binding protein
MYSTEEVGAKLRVSKRTVQRLIRNRKISSILVGGQRRITQEALDTYLKRQTCEAA